MEVAGITVPLWVAITLPTVYLVYRYLTHGHDLFKKMGINGPTPYPGVGTVLSFFKEGPIEANLRIRKTYGKLVGGFNFSKPVLTVFDTAMLKEILVKQFSNFPNRDMLQFCQAPMDKMMFVLKDEEWKNVRRHVTPTFSAKKLKKMMYWINKCSKTFRANLAASTREAGEVELMKHAGCFGMDVIAGTAFGLDIDSQSDPKNKFVTMMEKSQLGAADPRFVLVVFFPFLTKLLWMLNISIFPRDVLEFYNEVINQAVKHRKELADGAPADLLQLMVNAHKESTDGDDEEDEDAEDMANKEAYKDSSGAWTKKGLTHAEIVGQCFLIFFAGYGTISVTIAYVAYCLATNPDKQELVLEEVDKVMAGQDDVDYEMVKKMPYLGMCVDETLRLYPPAVETDRACKEDIVINGVFLPKGLMINIPIHAIHHDADLWEDPEKFIPERFTPEGKAKMDPYGYLPFGLGPRGCAGKRLGLWEVKVVIAQVLKEYKFVTCDKTEVPIKTKKNHVAPENGLFLRVEPRK